MPRGDVLLDPDPEPLLRHLYALLSGPAEHERPWDRIRDLFLPHARVRIAIPGPDGVEQLADWSVPEFAATARVEYAREGFWEQEVASRTERFGNIAHIFSTYESRTGGPDGPAAGRGINSVQFLRTGRRWRITSLVFQVEQPGAVIPARYLPSETGAPT